MGRSRECAKWAAVALGLYVALVGALLIRAGDPAWFIHLGSERIPVALARQVLGPDVSVPHLDGHDGRFFWVQARDPLLLHPRLDAANVDRPAYRMQRIGYPALAAPWRVFGEHGLVWGLLLTNLALVALGTFLTAQLALALRAPPRAGLAFAANPAVLFAVVFDTSDVLLLVGLVACVLCLVRGRWGAAIAGAVVAALAKEPALFGLAAIALLCPSLPRRVRVAVLAVPSGAVAAWALYARARLGWPATSIQEFTAPMAGYVDALRRGWMPNGDWGDAAIAVAVLALSIAAVIRWWGLRPSRRHDDGTDAPADRRRSIVLSAGLAYAALVPFFTAQVLDLADNSVRAVGPVITFLALDVYASGAGRGAGRRHRRALAGAVVQDDGRADGDLGEQPVGVVIADPHAAVAGRPAWH